MKKNKPLWIAITAVALVLIVTAATTVVPGLKISQYPLTTAPNGNDLFILADVTVVPNTNRSYKWNTLTNTISIIATSSVRIFAGTNVTVERTNNGFIISVTNITGGTGGTATASLPLNSIQFNSNTMFAGDSLLMYTNQNVGIGTNNPKYLLSLHNSDITEPAIDIGYDTGAGNTIAVQIRSGTGVTNMTMAVDGTLNSISIFNSGSITGSSATVSALNVTGGTLGAGKVLTDTGGSGSATWQDPTASDVWTNNAGVLHPRVLNGQQTNSIQIYTNGAMAIGLGTLSYWGVPIIGETLVSLRDTNFGDPAWNETFIGVKTGTNLFWQDHFMAPTANRRTYAMEQFGTTLKIDEYVDANSNFVYRAFNSNGFDMWHFSATGAGASNDTRYTFNSAGPVDSSDLLLALQNHTTNKFEVYGGAGNVNISGQITNQFLTASKFVKTDANKGLVSSTLDEAGITNLIAGVTGALTPGVTNVASATTIVIDLAATNTPCVSVTNVAAHNISIVVSNPYPGRWFSFYVDGSGLITNNALTWSSVAGLQLKWLDNVTNTVVVSNGFVNVSGWVATMNRHTNMVITYRDE